MTNKKGREMSPCSLKRGSPSPQLEGPHRNVEPITT